VKNDLYGLFDDVDFIDIKEVTKSFEKSLEAADANKLAPKKIEKDCWDGSKVHEDDTCPEKEKKLKQEKVEIIKYYFGEIKDLFKVWIEPGDSSSEEYLRFKWTVDYVKSK
jgi:hypothetical protein